MLQAPHMWSGEHGSDLNRTLAETQIILTWLDTQPRATYSRYQAYGRGKAKLMRRHMTELAATFPSGPPNFLTESIEHLGGKLGGERGEEFTEVNLESTFSGKTVRTMANEVGLGDLYTHVYQSASSVTHGEWWAIEDYAMQRCLNPLHRLHLIPSFDPTFPTDDRLARYWIAQVNRLVSLGLSQLKNDQPNPPPPAQNDADNAPPV